MGNKIIQIATAVSEPDATDVWVFALREDGTVWFCLPGDDSAPDDIWLPLPKIPEVS